MIDMFLNDKLEVAAGVQVSHCWPIPWTIPRCE